MLDYQYDDYPGTSFKSNRFAPENNYASTVGTFDANADANLNDGEWVALSAI